MQATPTDATLVRAANVKSASAPTAVEVPYVPVVTTDDSTLEAYPCMTSAISKRGMPWDSCAGLWLFNSRDPFYEWHANPQSYRVNGATGQASSGGTGWARVGFKDSDTIYWFDRVYGVFIPGLTESLAGAT